MDFELQIVNFAKLMMLAIVPYILASQGTMLGGRTGLFNVAQEGIMLLGASLGFLAAYLSGSNAAFFAPLISTRPFKGLPPTTRILSIIAPKKLTPDKAARDSLQIVYYRLQRKSLILYKGRHFFRLSYT